MAGNWTEDKKREILKTFTVMATIQKTYGREIDIRPTLQAWEALLAGEYSGEQVNRAMAAYMLKSSDMPSPADIARMITPETPKVSQAEFIHAKDQWAKEGYPSYSYYAMIVKQFEKENAEDRAPNPPIEDKRILDIVKASVKKISQ